MWRRYTLVRQNDRTDCGAAALATLAHHHRMPIDLERLRTLSHTDDGGASLLGLKRAAERIGLVAKAVHCPVEAVAELPLPAIVHVRSAEGDGHFVVLFRVGRRRVIVGDPASDVQSWTIEFFRKHWSGHVLMATPDPLHDRQDATTPPSRGQRLRTLLRPHVPLLVESIICALLMTTLIVATSYFVRHLVDSVLVRSDRPLLNALGLGMAAAVLFRTLFGVMRQYLLAHVGRKIDLALISTFAGHVLRLPLGFFEGRRAGEILSRVNDAAKLREAIGGVATTTVVDGILVVAVFAVLALNDLPLAVAILGVVAVLLVSVALHHPGVRRSARTAMEHGAHLASHLIEDVTGVETFKTCGAEPWRTIRAERRVVDFVESVFRLQKLDISMQAISMAITGMAGIGVLWLGGHRVIDGALTVGQLLFFFTLLSTLLEPLSRLSTVNLQIQDALVATDRLFQVLEQPAEPIESDKQPFVGVRREIALERVAFRYGNRSKVLDQIDLSIPAGSTVAIVGESGSGKSTLLKLLLQMYTPTAGRITIDGTDLHDFEIASLRSRIGVVPQDPFIFNGTLRENIALTRPDATLPEVIEAARGAGLEEFIAGLPDRYDTLIGERGTNLSGGQRQRLAIARVLLCQPDVLIFDEATSHLDTATERAIQQNLRTRLAGKTVVLVAHRLSTVRDADHIYVLHDGRVAEHGSHAELIHRGGRYAALWNAQTEPRDHVKSRPGVVGGPAAVGTWTVEAKV